MRRQWARSASARWFSFPARAVGSQWGFHVQWGFCLNPWRPALLYCTALPLGGPERSQGGQGSPEQPPHIPKAGASPTTSGRGLVSDWQALGRILSLTYPLGHSANVYGGWRMPGTMVGTWQTMPNHSRHGLNPVELRAECRVVNVYKGPDGNILGFEGDWSLL